MALRLAGSGFSPTGAGTGGAGAAGQAQLGAIFQKYRENSPDYGDIGRLDIEARGAEKRAAMTADANVAQQNIMSDAQIEAAQTQADAAKDAAEKQSDDSMFGSVLGAVGSIGGALLMSDESTKNSIEEIEGALAILRGLKPVTFHYNEEYACGEAHRLHYGFIAQEYQKAMPDATYHDTRLDKLSIDTSELIALLVSAIQTLEFRVTRMEAKHALEVGARS